MLDDRQLENLVRMAAEIEAMDALASGTSSAKSPQLRLVGEAGVVRQAQRRSLFSWRTGAVFGSVAAAAAAVAFMVVPAGTMTASGSGAGGGGIVKPPMAGGSPKLPNSDLYSGQGGVWPGALPWPFNGEPVDALAEAVPTSLRGSEIRGALLAILENDAGEVESVKWVEHNWDGTLAEAKASDLVALSLMLAGDRTPRQLTVVGLRGPANELPLGDARAQELASCIMTAPAKCSSMTCCNPGAAVECIPDDVSVRFERVSLR